MNIYKLLSRLGMFCSYAVDNESGGSVNYDSVEETQDVDAQRILDRISNGEEDFSEADKDADISLPSDSNSDSDDDDNSKYDNKEKLFANKYKTVDDLKNGIKNLDKSIPDYMLNGMNDESLEEHYNYLNKTNSSSKKHIIEEESDDVTKEEKPKEKDKPSEAKGIPQELWTDLSETYNTRGGITEAQYEALSKHGIPEDVVDGYLDGLVAKKQARANIVFDVAGGEENFGIMKEWAENNIDKDYIDSLGTMSDSQMKVALMGIKAQYELANKQSGRIIGSKNSGSSGSYRNQAEYMADVSDRRYSTDKNFRDKVDRKLSNSKL